MPKEKVKIEFTEKDIKELIAERHNLKLDSMSLYINHYKGDMREPAYTSIVAEGEKQAPRQG